MKKIILAICILATVASCKKSDDNDPNCERTVAGIAGNFKLTKIEISISGISTDVTTSASTDCQRNGVYQLKTDQSVIYTESGTCSDNGTGSWNVAGNLFSAQSDGGNVDFSSLDISGWDCSTLTLTKDNGSGSTTKYTLSKQ